MQSLSVQCDFTNTSFSLARAVSPGITLSSSYHIYDMSYIYGLASAAFVYFVLSHFFPAKETLLDEAIFDDPVVEGVEYKEAGLRSEKSDIEVETDYRGKMDV